MNLTQLKQFQEKPAPFTPGEPLFWDDPHISAQMLKAHLDPSNDLASRRPATIDRAVDWLIETLDLKPGNTLLDLGCGPGLYASRFARRGLQVTGVDYSQRSITYATLQAQEQNLEIDYRYQNYLELTDTGLFDAVLLIYGDYCPLSPEQRTRLLKNIRRALKPAGYFALDVTTPIHRQKHGSRKNWYLAETGFWKPGPHLVLENGFDYPDESIYLDQTIVIEDRGKVSVYRNWFQDFTRDTITRELEAGGFAVQSAWSDLTGTPYAEDTEWIGLVTRKK
jgi:SAM-dependent methyltransferase